MDLLSSVLSSLKIESANISRWQLCEPWGVKVCDFEPGYCLSVVEGHCWVETNNEAPVKLMPGDSLLAPWGLECTLKSSPETSTTNLMDLPWLGERFQGLDTGNQPTSASQVTVGGGGPSARLLGLAFTFQKGSGDFLLSALSPLMILRGNEAGILPLTHPAIECLIDDTSPGYFAVATQLAELILISVLRANIIGANAYPVGWLRGMQDQNIIKALSAIHAQPQHRWTVLKLAAETNMSRSAFAERFTRLVGTSPIDYLHRWRTSLAADQLRTTKLALSTIAQLLGYQSDRALRRVFKQHMGLSPQQYRQQFNRS